MYVYIIECGDGSFYAGMTASLGHRFKAHRTGRGAKHTSERLPVRLHAAWEVPSGKAQALKLERHIQATTDDSPYTCDPEKIDLTGFVVRQLV